MDVSTVSSRRHLACKGSYPSNTSTVVSAVLPRRGDGRATRTLLAGASLVVWAMVAVLAQAQEAPRPSVPLATFTTADFSGSGNCTLCHSGLTDTTGQDVSIGTHWRSTMMANAGKDPLWRAKVSAEVARNPALRSVIEDKCSTCHMPMARTQAVTTGSAVALLGDGFFNPAHPLHAAGADGVSCTLCHQVQNVDLGVPASFTGHYRIDTSTAPPNRLIHGPFVAPVQNQMRNVSGFTPVEGQHTRQSGLCATCHTLYTPTVDATGAVVGQLPEQTPYLEWEHSSYGDGAGDDWSCQQCHMPAAAGPAIISNRPGGGQLSPRSPFAQHYFVGANTFMLELLKTNADELGLTTSTTDLDATIQRTHAMVQPRAAKLSILEHRIDDRTLTAVVDVESLTGHKLPTGFPSRRAWIHLTVEDASGRMVFESGRPRDDGTIVGNAADESTTAMEPHYQRITDAGQVQIYEAIMQDTDGRVTYTLLRGASYAKDNRLLPAGFNPVTAPADVGVYGEARFDHDFTGGSDHVTYTVDVTGSSAPLTVTARLLYQSVSSRFVQESAHRRHPGGRTIQPPVRRG